MQPITKKVAKYYGAWALLGVCISALGNTLSDHGEYGLCAHLLLSFTGLPCALLSWLITPNGSTIDTFLAGAIGLFQWTLVAELISHFTGNRSSKCDANSPRS